MKITHFSVVFLCVFLPFAVLIHLDNRISSKQTIYNEQINRIMDRVVTDALYLSYDEDIHLDDLARNINELSSRAIYGTKSQTDLVKGKIMFIIYTQGDGFYVFREGEWSQKIPYEYDEHTKKVIQISKYIDSLIDKYGYKTLIPYNDGEDYKNTIHKECVLTFFKQAGGYYCFSGARVITE